MVLFPVREGGARVIKTWTPEQYAREEKASKKEKKGWEARGPSIPSTCGGLWCGQKIRPRAIPKPGEEKKPPRWGNKGGRKHQRKKQNKIQAFLAFAGGFYDNAGEQRNSPDNDTADDRLGDRDTYAAIAASFSGSASSSASSSSDAVASSSIYKWSVEQ